MISILGLGFILGLKHAMDADHLVAISTIIGERKGIRKSSLIGMFWGLGHMVSLLTVGLIVILMQAQIPPRVATGMELLVAAMLVLLGANTLRKLIKGQKLHVHRHQHGNHEHAHPHFHRPQRIHSKEEPQSHNSHHLITFGRKPFLVGLIHGMAGSSMLMLFILTTISSRFLGLLYIGAFALGSVGGMLLMSAVISLPFVLTARRFEKFNAMIQAFAAVFSIGFGIYFAIQLLGVGANFLKLY